MNFTAAQKIGLITAPLVFIIILLLPPIAPLSYEAQKVIAVVAWMLIWWISEAVKLPVAALLPIVLFPLLGVLKIEDATSPYASKIIFLFMGGFMIALALEKWNLHIRIALNIVKRIGSNANHIILGFMLATASLSMWISNTATTVMMLPIAASIIKILFSTQAGQSEKKLQYFALSLMLGIAYAANIGGVATIVGTPPNAVLVSILSESYGYEISFLNWMLLALPFSLVFLLIAYWVIVKWVYPNHLGAFENASVVIDRELHKLGSMSKGEKMTLVLFACTAFLWIFRGPMNQLLPFLKLSDPGIAIMASIALFIIPVNFQKGEFILKWEDTQKLPWGILLLFGGGLSMAKALDKVGIIQLIGDSIAQYEGLSIFLLMVLFTILVLFMTEVMSNVALVTVVVPVIIGIAVALGKHPLLFTIPATMASSCAFMLPLSTPPNAIVFASGHIKVPQMVRIGIFLNLIAIVLIVCFAWFLLPTIFAIKF